MAVQQPKKPAAASFNGEKKLAANGQKQLAAAYGEKNARKAAVPSHRVSAPDLASSSDGSSSQRTTTNSAIDELDCVLFLDVDGVLHPPNPKHERLFFRTSCMDLLKQICTETNCKIVLSTTWRLHEQGRATLAKKLQEHGIPTFVSRTPSIAQFQRPREILAWVNKHRPATWCAIDDWPLHEDGSLKGHFVQTRPRYGLQEDTAARVVAMLAAQRGGGGGGGGGGGADYPSTGVGGTRL